MVKVKTTPRAICIAILLLAIQTPVFAEDILAALGAFLKYRIDVEHRDVGMVIGIVDEHGSSVARCGKMDDGSNEDVNPDTLFEIGSITKTFTGLLLQDMVERGQMKLSDPVAKYLPESVAMPTYRGSQITLLQLATHTSGLPDDPNNLAPKRADNSRADYSVEKLNAFVSRCTLTREPGSKYVYSTVGIALLAEAIERKAGNDYESLVVDRICQPLKMDSTRITLTPELKSRLAEGHTYYGYPTSHTDWGALNGGAALRSTANDMLKYLAANLGLSSSTLTPLMQQTHVAHFHAGLDTDTDVDTDIDLSWMIMHDSDNATIIGHGGLTRGFTTFVGFDTARHRGVVVLCNSLDLDVPRIGRTVLQSEWKSELRPVKTTIAYPIDGLVGQYRISPSQANDALIRHGIGIRREGDRLFAQVTGTTTWPKHVLTPPLTDELVPESQSVFFERLSGVRITFSRDEHGKITRFSGSYRGKPFSYDKISNAPPEPTELPKRKVAIHLDRPFLDACAGHYRFPADSAYPTGIDLSIWREGNQLLGRESGDNVLQGTFDLYPESEATFFVQVDGAEFAFIKNGSGEVTVIQDYPGSRKRTGKEVDKGHH